MVWLLNRKNIGKIGTEQGKIIIEEEYKDRAKITLEVKEVNKKKCFALTYGISGLIVDTGFFETENDAKEAVNFLKHLIEIILK